MSQENVGAGGIKSASPAHPGGRVLAMFPFYNEVENIRKLAPKLREELVDKFVAVNDGSTDDGPDILRKCGIEVLDQPRSGIGACVKRCVRYAREHGYEILVVMAGNNKDDPAEIPRLVRPIVQNHMDYVQGSRFLPGGSYPHLPLFRWVAIRLLSFLFTLYARRKCTDLTNGFRAYRLSLLDDPRINIWQDWLDTYEYEYYVHWKAYMLGHAVCEVPVTKAYPADKNVKYTKIKPVSGWWRMLRPFLLLGLGIKK